MRMLCYHTALKLIHISSLFNYIFLKQLIYNINEKKLIIQNKSYFNEDNIILIPIYKISQFCWKKISKESRGADRM